MRLFDQRAARDGIPDANKLLRPADQQRDAASVTQLLALAVYPSPISVGLRSHTPNNSCIPPNNSASFGHAGSIRWT